MFDDFKQEKNESKEPVDLFSSQDFPMIRKLGLGVLVLLVLSVFAWFSLGSGGSNTSDSSNSQIEKRLAALEKTVFSNHHATSSTAIAVADTGSGPVGPFNNSILDNPSFPPESDDEVLPMEEQIGNEQNKISSESSKTPPKEIALELSSLFEKEMAMSSPTPSSEIASSNTVGASDTSATSKTETLSKKTAAKTYTVQKGDTLSKISLKFYGTSKKWKKILDANREKLGQNQVLRAGMVVVIPDDNG